MNTKCEKEIHSIHEFFENWLSGRIEKNQETLLRVDEALSDRFLMISPNGNEADKITLNKNLMKAHGSWSGEEIWIKNMRCRYNSDNLCLMVYEEWQGERKDTTRKGRLSSALFEKRVDGKIQWLHLHEVWISK